MIEAKDETEIGAHTGKLVPKKKMSAATRHEFEKKRRENLKKKPGDAPGDNKFLKALRDKAKREGNYAEEWVQEGNKSGDSSLRDWFGKSRSSDGTPGWVQLGGKYSGKPCAKQPGQTTKPKCGSSKMKRNLNKDEEDAAFRRKNIEDGNPNRKGKAINVDTEKKKKKVSEEETFTQADKVMKKHRKRLNDLHRQRHKGTGGSGQDVNESTQTK